MFHIITSPLSIIGSTASVSILSSVILVWINNSYNRKAKLDEFNKAKELKRAEFENEKVLKLLDIDRDLKAPLLFDCWNKIRKYYVEITTDVYAIVGAPTKDDDALVRYAVDYIRTGKKTEKMEEKENQKTIIGDAQTVDEHTIYVKNLFKEAQQNIEPLLFKCELILDKEKSTYLNQLYKEINLLCKDILIRNENLSKNTNTTEQKKYEQLQNKSIETQIAQISSMIEIAKDSISKSFLK
ncbi:MAG: hypothetical protein QM528_03740 [Phycisphaerales bacterium]|nr:hypothetical protein [Phycisphaerales bacterium]